MKTWRMTAEPSLDELLSDEIMDQVTKRAGLDTSELRRRLADLAHRLDGSREDNLLERCLLERCGPGFR